MSIKASIATTALNTARSIGRNLGCQLEVTLNNQHIKTRMVPPGAREDRVWDPELYAHGQLYYGNYANPIKPIVEYNKQLDEKDEVSILYSTQQAEAVTDGGEDVATTVPHVEMMSSERYQEHMNNHMVSELVTPDAQWDKLFYAILLVGAITIVGAMLSIMIATGTL